MKILSLSLLLSAGLPAQVPWTLQQCIDRALDKNISLNQKELGNEVNKLSLSQSRANRIPDLNLVDAHALSFGRAIDPSTNQYVDQNISGNNLGLNSTIILYNGFYNEYLIRLNELNYEAGNAEVESAKNNISLAVVAAYLQVLLAYEQVDNASNQLASTTAQADRTQKFVNAGKFPESSLLQVQSQLAADKLAVVTAENNLQISKVTLMQLIELPVTNGFEIEKPNVTELMLHGSTRSADSVYNTASEIMPQVKNAELKTRSADMSLKLAQSTQMPVLSLSGSLRTAYSSARDMISYQSEISTIGYLQNSPGDIVLGHVQYPLRQNYPFMDQFNDNFSQVISLNLTVPIFNNKQVKTSIAKAKINRRISELEEQSTRNELRKSVELAVTDSKAAEKKFDASAEQFNTEERSYKNLETKFNLGMVTSTDFLIEKSNYQKAISNKVQAKYDFLFKLKVLDYYLGKPLTF